MVVAQQPQTPVFRSGTEIVDLYVTVTDRNGRLVPNLSQEDFEVLDEGVVQEIVLFENEVRPITVVVMLDTSASMTPSLDLLMAGAEQFIIRMLPDDRGKVGAFNDKIQILPETEFIGDRDRLIRALERLQFGNPTRLYDAIGASVDALQGVEGRKVALVFTDGEDTQHEIGWRDALDKARTEEVMLYTIGLEMNYHNGVRMVRSRPDGRAQDVRGGDRRRVLRVEGHRRAGTDVHARCARAAQPVCGRLCPDGPGRQDPRSRGTGQSARHGSACPQDVYRAERSVAAPRLTRHVGHSARRKVHTGFEYTFRYITGCRSHVLSTRRAGDHDNARSPRPGTAKSRCGLRGNPRSLGRYHRGRLRLCRGCGRRSHPPRRIGRYNARARRHTATLRHTGTGNRRRRHRTTQERPMAYPQRDVYRTSAPESAR